MAQKINHSQLDDIVEQDLNTDSGYIRYASGRQVAWKRATLSIGGTLWISPIYYSDHTMGNWEAPFTSIQLVSTYIDSLQYWAGNDGVSNTSAGRVRAFRPTGTTLTTTVRVSAEGQWKQFDIM